MMSVDECQPIIYHWMPHAVGEFSLPLSTSRINSTFWPPIPTISPTKKKSNRKGDRQFSPVFYVFVSDALDFALDFEVHYLQFIFAKCRFSYSEVYWVHTIDAAQRRSIRSNLSHLYLVSIWVSFITGQKTKIRQIKTLKTISFHLQLFNMRDPTTSQLKHFLAFQLVVSTNAVA